MTTLPASGYVSNAARTQGEMKIAHEATNSFIRDKFGSESLAITSIASASTVDLGAVTSDSVLITGTTGPITSFGTAAAGVRRKVRTASTPTFTNSGALACPGGVSFTASAGTTFEAESLGSGNWIIRSLQLGTGIGSMVLLASGTAASVATLDLTLPSGYRAYKLFLYDFRPVTSGQSLLFRLSYDSGSSYLSATNYSGTYTYTNTSNATGTAQSGNNVGASQGQITFGHDNTNNFGNSSETTIFPGSATSFANTLTQHAIVSGGNIYVGNQMNYYGANGRATNIRLFYGSGNIQTLTYALYGVL